jgi:hypothetical protein
MKGRKQRCPIINEIHDKFRCENKYFSLITNPIIQLIIHFLFSEVEDQYY